jgi:hypothetical protein
MNATYGGAVYLNFSSDLIDKDLFVNVNFISLQAIQQGGAVYTKAGAGFVQCKFVNNSAGNNEGNDIYSTVTTTFYSDSYNVRADCSLSISPSKLLISNGV